MAKTNILKNINDSLLVEVKPKFSGNLTLTGYSDTIIGNNVAHGIKVEFRIITESLFYDDWKILNGTNIANVKVQPNQIIQIRYTRISNNNGDNDYVFKSIVFDGDYEYREISAPTLNRSIFSDVAWQDSTERLAQNLFKKLYFRGIVPNYIIRGANLSLKEDEDYSIFFSSISKFFAIILNFFKRFESPLTDFDLLKELVKQHGVSFDEGSISLSDLQNISKNIYNEISKRGTKQIFDNGGEFLRLVHYDKDDELLYENVPKCCVGWCLGKSSPMYKGITDESVGLNKTGEDSKDFKDINKFTTHGAISIINSDNKGVLHITQGGGLGMFFGQENNKKFINVDPNLDYEISFYFRILDANKLGNITISISGFDNLKNPLNDAFIHPNNDEVTEYAVKNMKLLRFSNDVWYRFSCILYAYYSENREETLNIGVGNPLHFNNPFLKYIIPNIHVENEDMELWNYKIRPLIRGRNILPMKGNNANNAFSLGFIQAANFFHVYYKNNNNNQSCREVTSIIERYLLPYSSVNLLTAVNE